MIVALILAAGKGLRFGSADLAADDLPKQFSEIAGKALFVHSIQAYTAITEIDQIVVVANSQYVEQTTKILERHDLLARVTLGVGGATRQASVRNAVTKLGQDGLTDQDIVILHNSVSPNTPPTLIRSCLSAMSDSDAVQACVADTRTVCETDGEFIRQVLPRSGLAVHCDPTIYRGDVLRHVLEVQKDKGMHGETTSDTARELGYKIRLIQSDYGNIKVTNRWDLAAVSAAMGRITD